MEQLGLEAALENVRQFVQTKVAAGFLSLDEIKEEAVAIGAIDALAEEVRPFVPGILQESLRAHEREQATWPEETDYDRLAIAFEKLERVGILARNNFSCCGNCGAQEIRDEIDAAKKAGRPVSGYTFYHMQDTDAAVEGYGLYLSYGATEEGEEPALSVARQVLRALEAQGLETRWNSSWSNRLFAKMDWKRRRPTAEDLD